MVSIEAYGPQQSHLFIQIWLNNCSQNTNPLYFFKVKIGKEKAFSEKNAFCEMFLKFNYTWKYTCSEILKTVKEFILRLNEDIPVTWIFNLNKHFFIIIIFFVKFISVKSGQKLGKIQFLVPV